MARLSNSRRGAAFIFSAALAFALLLVVPLVQASANVGNEAAHLVHVRHHNGMMRVRKPPQGPDDPKNGNDLSTTTTTTDSSTSALPSSTSSEFSTSTSSIDTSSFTSTTTTSSTTSTSTSTSSTISTSSFVLNTTTTSSTPSTTTTTSSTSSTPLFTSTTTTSDAPLSTSTVIVAAPSSTTSSAPSPTSNPSSATSESVAIARKTIVVLVAIAGSIGVAFLIWTGIRKWKFRPSRGFEDRMQDPINWQPNAVGHDNSDPAYRIAAHRRNASNGSHGSFGSSEMAHNNIAQPAQYAGYGATGATGVDRSLSGRSIPNNTLPPLPPHDFTAGANGSDAYEFYHGQGQQPIPGVSSSPPQMVENGLTRGGSIARPVSMRSENPYDGLDEDYNQQPALPPHHGGAYAAPSASPTYRTSL